jgi:hypothetical protein
MRANGTRKRVIVGLSNKTVGIVTNEYEQDWTVFVGFASAVEVLQTELANLQGTPLYSENTAR